MWAALLVLLALPRSRAVDPCALNQTCIPTRADYDMNADSSSTVAPLGPQHWVECRGPYALCAFANCTAMSGTDPPLAECGCDEPAAEGRRHSWYVTPRQLKSQAVYNLTSGFCYQGDAFANNNTECQETNSAPACAAITENWIYSGNYELISTFTPTQEMDHTTCTGPGVMAECMSAACYRKEAFDGSPVTCYCLLVDVPPGHLYSIGSRRWGEQVGCEQPEGFAISGEYTNEEA